jgi:steroid 5-alpha reductase family enzyme
LRGTISFQAVDPIILLSIVMLVVWAAGTWFEMAGWIHILLTAGVFLLAWRIATRGAKAPARK